VEAHGLAELLLLGSFGLGVGALHVLSPDHWVALLPISLDAGRRGWRVGLQWGIGHALVLSALGLLAYGVRDFFDLELLGESGDWLIGAVLVGIGAWGLWHRERSGHSHAADGHSLPGANHVHSWMAFGVGAVHGVGGTGAFLVALPALGFDSWIQSLAYVIGFAAGTILAMLALSALLGTLAARIDPNGRFGRGYRRVFSIACWLAIVGGIVWLVTPDWVHEDWFFHRHR